MLWACHEHCIPSFLQPSWPHSSQFHTLPTPFCLLHVLPALVGDQQTPDACGRIGALEARTGSTLLHHLLKTLFQQVVQVERLFRQRYEPV